MDQKARREKLKEINRKIADFWLHFAYEHPYVQKMLNFEENRDNNYCGDITSFFNDTIDLIDFYQGDDSKAKFKECYFYIVGSSDRLCSSGYDR